MAGGGDGEVEVPEIQTLFRLDGYLKPHEREIRRRYMSGET